MAFTQDTCGVGQWESIMEMIVRVLGVFSSEESRVEARRAFLEF